jgi:hypothetical protein
LEKLTLLIAPGVGSSTGSVGAIGNLYRLRAYRDGPERRDGLIQVVVENLEVLLLKIGDTLSGRRRNYDIETNVSGGRTAFTGALLRRGCRNTKHHHRHNGKYTLAEHKFTSTNDVIGRIGRPNSLISNPKSGPQTRTPASNPQPTLDTHDKMEPDTNSPAQAGLYYLAQHFSHSKSKPKVSAS